MGQLVAAVALFVLAHGAMGAPAARGWLVALLGERGYIIAHSAVSVVLLGWVAHAYAQAPYVEVWPQRYWMRWVPAVVMPVASVLMVAGLTAPNPLSIGFARGYDPARPGVLRFTRHPVIWALGLWAAAHVPPNGDVAALILFLPLLVLSLFGPTVMDRKRRRLLGAKAWGALAAETGRPLSAPLAALREIGWARLLAGLALYVALAYLHPIVIGVWAFPY